MYASIPDALRALARKIGADANGRNEEEILNNIVVKLGGTPVTNHGVAGSIDAMTKVVDLDVMHNMTTLNVTPTSEAQTIIPESPVDGYSQVNVAAVPAPSTFSVNMTATTIDQSSASITTDKTFAQTLQALNNGENVSLTVTVNTSGTEYVCENVCCGIAHAVTNPDNEFIYAVVEIIGGGVMTIVWLQDDNSATIGISRDAQWVIGQ